MPPTNATEEIIEKKASSPVATSCLIISMVALIAGMVFQVMEIGEYRKNPIAANVPNPGLAKAKADIASFQKSVSDILERKAAGGDAVGEGDKVNDEKATPKPDDAGTKEPKADDAKDAGDAKDGAKDPTVEPGVDAAPAADAKPEAGDAKDADAKEPAEPAAGDAK